MGVAVCESRGVGELRCEGDVVCGSHGVGELHCGGVAVSGGRGGYQSLFHCVYGFFFNFPRFFRLRKKIDFIKNPNWLNRLPWLIFKGVWNKQGCQSYLGGVSIRF